MNRDLVPWATEYPDNRVVPLTVWFGDAVDWLANRFDLGLFTFKEFTRAISNILEWTSVVIEVILLNGASLSIGEQTINVPPVSWLGLVGFVIFLGLRRKDWKLASISGSCVLYLAVFGQWSSSMETLTSIVCAVPIGVIGGTALGILAYRIPWFERVLTPILDLMQTVPVFAYLVLVLILFGFGPTAAIFVTVIYAMPPMVRCTTLALKSVLPEIIDAGLIMGCKRWQMLWLVLLPSARPMLMVGVNQVIMLSLNMVIIASMIGAGGLGFDVLFSLKRLALGQGLEAGLAITLLAIASDRLTRADYGGHDGNRKDLNAVRRLKVSTFLFISLSILVIPTLFGEVIPALAVYPETITITTGEFINRIVKWINIELYFIFQTTKDAILIYMFLPLKKFLLYIPWLPLLLMLTFGGFQLGGKKLALLSASMFLFIAVAGLWDKAMVTIYLCGVSVVIAYGLGVPLGIWAARNDRVHGIILVVIDTLQTMPSFVYLIPVVMLFGIGDFPAMIAIVAYAIAPAIRYTDHGIRHVPETIVEAARSAGCTDRQVLWMVQFPLAFPEILLGLNQTIMMALSMLVITALVGTSGLGQEVFIALSNAAPGLGIVTGLSIAFIAIVADRMITSWTSRRKRELGFE